MIRITLLTLAPAVLLAACATTPDAQPSPPDYAEIATQPAPANARLYADCFGQAIRNQTYRRAAEGGDELLLHTCTGDAAHAMFTALGPWSAQIGSEWRAQGRVWRSTAVVQRNLIGADYCSATEAGDDARCVITFNAGDFLDQ
ncbi:hypothetical protein [Brevundimonas sp.]|uniref:hypothetical protein n=1 Tax=Brevundimonas sp. TaxID=1871086 RepID=UPI003BA92A85